MSIIEDMRTWPDGRHPSLAEWEQWCNEARPLVAAFLAEMEGDLDIIRVDGAATCPECGSTYRDHPWDEAALDWQGHPFVRVGCDGRRLKL